MTNTLGTPNQTLKEIFMEPNDPRSSATLQKTKNFWLNPDGSWRHALIPEKNTKLRFV